MKAKYIQFGGESRPVRYSFNALSEYAERTGMGWQQMLETISQINFYYLRIMVYVGLKHGALEAKIPFNHSFDAVGDWLENDISKVKDFTKEFLDSLAKMGRMEEKQKTATAKQAKTTATS